MTDNNISNKNFLYTVNSWDTYQSVKKILKGIKLKDNICIGLVGKIASGKSTCANILVDKYNFKRFYFSKPLKIIIKKIFQLDDSAKGDYHLYNNTYNLDNLNILFKKYGLERLTQSEINEIKKITNDRTKSYVYRRLMQFIGTDIIRKRNEDFFVSEMYTRIIDENNNIIIDDIRFENEYNLLNSLFKDNFYLIKIIRPIKNNINSLNLHSSETFVDKIDGDILIINDGSILDLDKKIKKNIDLITKKGLLYEKQN